MTIETRSPGRTGADVTKGRTWGRRGHTPVVRVTGVHNKRVSLAALIAVKPGCRPRLIYRTPPHVALAAGSKEGGPAWCGPPS